MEIPKIDVMRDYEDCSIYYIINNIKIRAESLQEAYTKYLLLERYEKLKKLIK